MSVGTKARAGAERNVGMQLCSVFEVLGHRSSVSDIEISWCHSIKTVLLCPYPSVVHTRGALPKALTAVGKSSPSPVYPVHVSRERNVPDAEPELVAKFNSWRRQTNVYQRWGNIVRGGNHPNVAQCAAASTPTLGKSATPIW